MRSLLLAAAAALLFAWAAPFGVGGKATASAPKTIALSFDDSPRGPGAFMTVEQRNLLLIAALKKAGVDQAVFFANPGRITPGDGDEARLDRYVAAGHVIGNHTFLHPGLMRTPADAYVEDIAKADAWLRPRLGFRPWFRFPALDEGGPDKAKRDVVRSGLARLKLMNAYASVDGSDWYIEGMTIAAKRAGKPIDVEGLRTLYVETMVQSADFSDTLMLRTLKRRAPQMMLLHETDIAALFIVDLVQALRRDGWTIVTADQVLADPAYRVLPDIPWANGTLAEQLAAAQKIPGPRWYERNDRKIASGLFIERVLHGPAAPPPLLRPDPAALAKAGTLPHIPVALRGCWQAVGADERLTVNYASIEVAGPARTIALAESVSRVTPRRIDGAFVAATGDSRPLLTKTLSLGPDDLGTPAGQLRLAGGDSGGRAFTRCT